MQQSLQDFELLIVDDGSTDGTQELIKSFKDKRIQFTAFEENKGVVFSRNYAIQNSRGTYIALMDHDDISHPNRLEIQFALLEKTQSDVCTGHHLDFYEATGNIKKRKSFLTDPDLRGLLTIYSPLIHPLVMMRRVCLSESTYSFDYEFAEDYALWCDLALQGAKFIGCSEYLLTYRIHSQQMTQQKQKKNHELTNIIRSSYVEKLLNLPLPYPMKFTKRINQAKIFMLKLNQCIPGMSWRAKYQIYARFQYHGNGWKTPFIRLERIFAAIIY